jgi:hypothetical protein
MGLYDHWSIGPPGLHFGLWASFGSFLDPPRLYFESLKLQNFVLNADTDPAYKDNADPYPQPGSLQAPLTMT